jgi:LuxR family transcriptional regulator, maltose regulon positive regulatory protein
MSPDWRCGGWHRPYACAVATEASGVLLSTKLNPPVVGELVQRTRLVEALAESTQRLKLVRAPAGWGKSTLVAAWSAAENRPFAWLALDTADSDAHRFWTYVIESIRSLDGSVGEVSAGLLNAPGTGIEEHVIPALVNEIADLREPAVLAIDDYQAIDNPEIHAQLSRFVEHLPSTFQVSLTSRAEPPLPLARWRARGELLEVDAAELRFAPDEAEHLLNEILDLDLESSQVASLCERTEGWAAGLYLAALSLRGAPDRALFVERFAGDDRNVVDYLAGEVLGAQPPHVRDALGRTSILDRFCAPLVEAVCEVDDGAAFLREVERANLFLLPLDSKRQWYRYHHLFQHILQLELFTEEHGLVPELHRRAATWHLEAGLIPEAIEHTLAAGDLAEAIELIAQHWAPTLLERAGDSAIDSWLEALGDEAVAQDFRLCFARCFVDLSYGRMDTVARWLEVADKAPLRGPSYEGLTSKAGGLACVRAAHYWESGDVGRSLPAARAVLEEEGEDSPWRAIGAAVIGLASAALGDWTEGSRWTREYSRLGAKFGQHLNQSSGAGSAAAFEAELGNWAEAEALARNSLEISSRYGMDEHWMTSEAHLALGLLLAHKGDLEQAEPELERSAEVARRGAGPVSTAHALLHLARVRVALGDSGGAREALDEAERRVAAAPDPGILPERLAKVRSRLGAPARTAAPGEELSERELDVLRLLASPLSQREIGDRLYVSLNTVKSHTRSIFRKLDASGRPEAVARARELGLL